MFWYFIALFVLFMLKLTLNSKFSKISLGQSKPLGFINILKNEGAQKCECLFRNDFIPFCPTLMFRESALQTCNTDRN